MVDSLKQIKNRIRTIEGTRKVTHAMEMISVAKLKSTESELFVAREYFTEIKGLLDDILSNITSATHPLLTRRGAGGRAALCLITSDSGLSSDYNPNIIRATEAFINKYRQEGILLIAAGKKGFKYFQKKGVQILAKFIESKGSYSKEVSARILTMLTDIFLSGKADEVYIASTYFGSISKHVPAIEKLFPIDSIAATENLKYIVEPDIAGILAELIPIYSSYKIKLAFLNAFTCEHTSRMIAMAEATNNAEELLEGLVLSRNKLRQANITKELIELISSSELLK